MKAFFRASWEWLRLALPPWRQLDHPLVQYEIRRHLRTGWFSWGMLAALYLFLVSQGIFLLNLLVEDRFDSVDVGEEILLPVFGTFLGGLWLLAAVGHWQLLLAASARGAQMIAGRRQRGDWDLIFVTPLPKSRWLWAQWMALGWQLYPLVRFLVIIHTVMLAAVLVFIYVVPDIQPSPLYYFLIVPFFMGIALYPLLEVGAFTAAALRASAFRKGITMSIANGFINVYIMRVIMTAILFYGSIAVLFTIGLVMNAVGYLDDNISLSELFGDEMITAAMYCCMAIPVAALFVEWLPAIIPLAMIEIERFDPELAWLYSSALIIGLTVYILVPMWFTGWSIRRTIWRLEQQE